MKWKNYKALGNLHVDFRKPNGNAYSTIVLAGENGTGKTTILETLGQFLTGHSMEPFEYMNYDANGKEFHIEPLPGEALWGFHTRQEALNPQGSSIRMDTPVSNIRSNHSSQPESMKNDSDDIRSHGCIYSSAKANFDTKKIQNITSEEVDTTQYLFDDNNDFSSIKQLLIDIVARDSNFFANEARKNHLQWEEFEPQSKMYRFKAAFNGFFEHIKFDRVDGTAGQQKVFFQKYNNEILIDELSTGEKQIVFRGAYLLRNIGKIDGGIILIDEPELSMHPQWQERILPFYQNLFTQNGEQKAQIIIATHSEYVIRKALEDKDNTLVIILKDDNGTVKGISSRTPYILPYLTSAEVNFQAFNIYSVDYHIELYGYLQMLTECSHIKDMEKYLVSIVERAGVPFKNAMRKGKIKRESLPTYIRNSIDHPDNTSRTFTSEELKLSTDFLIQQIQNYKPVS